MPRRAASLIAFGSGKEGLFDVRRSRLHQPRLGQSPRGRGDFALHRRPRDQDLDRAARRPPRHGLFRAAAERDRAMPRLRRAGHRDGEQIALCPRRDGDGLFRTTSRSSRSARATSSPPPASPSSSRSATGPNAYGDGAEASMERLALELRTLAGLPAEAAASAPAPAPELPREPVRQAPRRAPVAFAAEPARQERPAQNHSCRHGCGAAC